MLGTVILVGGIGNDGKHHIALRGLRKVQNSLVLAKDRSAVDGRAIRSAVGNLQGHVGEVSVEYGPVAGRSRIPRLLGPALLQRELDACGPALNGKRDDISAAPARRGALFRSKHVAVRRSLRVRSHIPRIHSDVARSIFTTDVRTNVLIQEGLHFGRPLFHIEQGKLRAVFQNDALDLFFADRCSHTFENVLAVIVRDIHPNPRHSTFGNPEAKERREKVSVLHAAKGIAPVALSARIHAFCARTAERTIQQPAGIALDRYEGGHQVTRIQKAHAAVFLRIAATHGHFLLEPGVSAFLEPVHMCRTQVREDGVNALVDHRLLLRHLVAVGATRVKTVDRVVRGRNRRVTVDMRLPAALFGIVVTARAGIGTVQIDGAVIAVLHAAVSRPAERIGDVGKVLVEFFEQGRNRSLGHQRILVRAMIKRPIFAVIDTICVLGRLHAGTAHVLGRLLVRKARILEVVIQLRTVGRPGVGLARGKAFRCKQRRHHSSAHQSHTLFLHNTLQF